MQKNILVALSIICIVFAFWLTVELARTDSLLQTVARTEQSRITLVDLEAKSEQMARQVVAYSRRLRARSLRETNVKSGTPHYPEHTILKEQLTRVAVAEEIWGRPIVIAGNRCTERQATEIRILRSMFSLRGSSLTAAQENEFLMSGSIQSLRPDQSAGMLLFNDWKQSLEKLSELKGDQ